MLPPLQVRSSLFTRNVRVPEKLPQLPAARFASVSWQVAPVPRLPELKLGPGNAVAPAHRSEHGVAELPPPQVFGVPPPPHVWGDAHVPHELTVRGAPQLSVPVSVPHVAPSRAQNAALVSGVQLPPALMFRVALSNRPPWSVTRTLAVNVPELGGVPPSAPLLATVSQVGPLCFEYVSVSAAFGSAAVPASVPVSATPAVAVRVIGSKVNAGARLPR